MIDKVLTAIFGSKHERDVKRMLPTVAQINALEPEISGLSDDELRGKTQEFRERLKPVVGDGRAVDSCELRARTEGVGLGWQHCAAPRAIFGRDYRRWR